MAAPKTPPLVQRILVEFFRRAFQSGMSVMFLFAGICAILAMFNHEFLIELVLGLTYVAIAATVIGLIIYFVNERRIRAGQPLVRFTLRTIWDAVIHNSLTASVSVLVFLLVISRITNISTEAHKAMFSLWNEFLSPILYGILVIAIACFGLWVIIAKGIGGNHHKK